MKKYWLIASLCIPFGLAHAGVASDKLNQIASTFDAKLEQCVDQPYQTEIDACRYDIGEKLITSTDEFKTASVPKASKEQIKNWNSAQAAHKTLFQSCLLLESADLGAFNSTYVDGCRFQAAKSLANAALEIFGK